MSIMHNNVIYDGVITEPGEVPVKVVSSRDQLYPLGSICSLNLIAEGHNHTIFLRGDIKFEVEGVSPQ
jgi:hypothetical protein